MVDAEDAARAGQEIAAGLSAQGVPNFDQAARIAKFNLDRSILGNTYVEFETSVRGLGLRPGDLISLTYLKEGFERQPFRVLKVTPALNYRTVTITAQIHNDDWYADTNGRVRTRVPAGRPGARIGLPRPLVGNRLDENGDLQFAIAESAKQRSDSRASTEIALGFSVPGGAQTCAPAIPF